VTHELPGLGKTPVRLRVHGKARVQEVVLEPTALLARSSCY
jgi:hypothetical protein